MNSITQDIIFKQSVVEYSLKHGVTEAAKRYKQHRKTIYRWREKYDGSRKSLVNKWHLEWDEKLIGYAYAEDLDFSYAYYKKAKQENLRCIMTNKVRVLHLASQEFRTPTRKHMFMYVLNRYYLSNKHHMGWKSMISMKLTNNVMVLFQKLKGGNSKDLKDAIHYLKYHKEEIKQGKFNF